MKVLIMIPTYNEAENIGELVRQVLAVTPPTTHIVVADDNSPDGTGKLVDALAAKDSRVHALHRPKKAGLGPAYIGAMKWGMDQGFEALVEMDADFSHHPRFLKAMHDGLEQSDVVIGSRYVPGGGTVNWGIGRKILSRFGSLYARIILGANIRDFTGGFNGWRVEVLKKLNLDTLKSDGYSFQIELKYRAHLLGYRIKEFAIIFEDRKVGKSKMSKKIVFEALKRVWEFRFTSRARMAG